jgi:hypothetical protein
MLDDLVDITEQDYQLWKRHPMSAIFFAWVDDRLADYRAGAADSLEYGSIDPVRLAEFKHRIAFCRELKDLRFSDIWNFYEVQKAQAEKK